MRVLALGALWVPYIRDNWFDALEVVLGEQVTCINVGPLLANKEKYTSQPEGFQAAYIYDLLRREKFDYLFFYHDWIFADFPDEFFAKVRSTGVKTITFHPDDEPDVWYNRNKQYDHHYDLIASHSSQGVNRRIDDGFGERVVYLPWGYNPRTCFKRNDTEKKFDVIFFGKHKVNEGDNSSFVEDGLQREQVLVTLAQFMEAKGWSFKLFGFGWDKHPELSKYAGGIPSQEEMVEVINRSKIVFNPAWSSDGASDAVQTKLRHFEVPGYGAFQITNENAELAELFVPDEEIVFYSSDDELLKKIEIYINDDVLREKVADSAHSRCLEEHTLDHRVKHLFEVAEQRYPIHMGMPTPIPKIHQIVIHNSEQLCRLCESMQQTSDSFQENEWVHFIGGEFTEINFNYDLLRTFFETFKEQVLQLSSYIDFRGDITYNPLQPKLIETHSLLLESESDVNEVGFSLQGEGYLGSLVGVQKKNKIKLLINYLVPASKAIQFLAYFSQNDYDKVNTLEVTPTGKIISEAVIQMPAGVTLNCSNVERFAYVKRLRVILPIIKEKKIAVYGISGMGEVTLKLFKEYSIRASGIIDRSITSTSFNDSPVITPSEIQTSNIEVIIITAGASGPEIYSEIKYLEGSVCIIPLFDLDHPVWSILGI